MAKRIILSRYAYTEVYALDASDPGRILDLGRLHFRRRDLFVARVLAHLSLLPRGEKGQSLGRHPTLRVGSPIVQDRLARQDSEMAAVHCIPGQLWLAGQLPWDLVSDEQVVGLTDLHHAFAATDNLPSAFARADELCQGPGSRLSGLLARSCAKVWTTASSSSTAGLANLRVAWEEWMRGSETLHQAAAAASERGGDDSEGKSESCDLDRAVLQAYAALGVERRGWSSELLRASAEEVFGLMRDS